MGRNASARRDMRWASKSRAALGSLMRVYRENWRVLANVVPHTASGMMPRTASATSEASEARPERSPGAEPMRAVELARTLLGEMEAEPYERFRSWMEIQRTLLHPPGPAEQGDGQPLRITTSAPNPARAHREAPRTLRFTIEDEAAPDAGETGTRYHWYLQPMRWAGMPDMLADSPRVTMLGRGEAYDLGTGESARFPASHEGVYIVIATAEDAEGHTRGTARYLQTVLKRRNIAQLSAFEAYLARMDDLAARIAGPLVPVTAVHVDESTGQASLLRLFLGRSEREPGKLLLLDMTLGLNPEEHRLVYEGATFDALMMSFERSNEYPVGAIALRIPPNGLGIEPQVLVVLTDRTSRLGGLSSTVAKASLGLSLGAAALIPFIGSGSLLVSGLLLGAGMASITSGALGLADHLQNEDFHELGVLLDITSIGIGLAGSGLALRSLLLGRRKTGRIEQILVWSSIAAQGITGILVVAEGSDRLTRIIRNEGLSREERLKSLVRAAAELIFNGAILGTPPSELETFRDRRHGFLAEIAGDVSAPDRLTLVFVDDQALRGLQGATAEDLQRLADMLHDEPSLIGRLAGRSPFRPGER